MEKPNYIYKVPNLTRIIGLPVLEKKRLKVFTIFGHGGHLGHVTWTIYINFRSPFPKRLHMKFGIMRLNYNFLVTVSLITKFGSK